MQYDSKKNHIDKLHKPTVALIVPQFLSASSFLQPPIDMLIAAAHLRNAGYNIIFIDNRVDNLSTFSLAKKLSLADIIVVTTTPYDHIQNYFLDYRLKLAFKTINDIKTHNSKSYLIVCGAHGSVRPDIVFKESLADVIVKWDYDYYIVKVINTINNKKDLRQMQNVCLRGEESFANSIQEEKRNFLSINLDDGVLPAFDLIDFNQYYGDVYINNKLHRQENTGIILASRGCKYNCMFCFNFWGREVRYRDPLQVVEEFEFLQKYKNINHLFFIDFNLVQDKN